MMGVKVHILFYFVLVLAVAFVLSEEDTGDAGEADSAKGDGGGVKEGANAQDGKTKEKGKGGKAPLTKEEYLSSIAPFQPRPGCGGSKEGPYAKDRKAKGSINDPDNWGFSLPFARKTKTGDGGGVKEGANAQDGKTEEKDGKVKRVPLPLSSGPGSIGGKKGECIEFK